MEQISFLQWLAAHIEWIIGICVGLSLFFKKVREFVKWCWRTIARAIAPLHAPDELYELRQTVIIDAELAPIMRFNLDTHGKCTWISNAFLDRFGWQESKVKGTTWENIIAREDLPTVRALWQRCFETGDDYENEQRIKTRDGDKVLCRVKAKGVKTKLGKVEYFRGVVEEVKWVTKEQKSPTRR